MLGNLPNKAHWRGYERKQVERIESSCVGFNFWCNLLSEDLSNGSSAFAIGQFVGNIAGGAVGAAMIAGGFVAIRNLLVGRGR